ncbi:MAG: AAA family ATPase, partial [Sutterella sp.]|nr:AAA family ATPase [Sutterella sp.]
MTLKNLSGSTLLYLKATDLESITVNMKIEAVQPKTQTITHKVYSSPISSVQSAILRKQPHSSHSPSENAYAKPFGNYGIRQELLKEFNRKEAEEKKEQAKLSSAPKSAAPVTSTKPEEKPSRDEGTITVKKGWKKERNQHVEHITPTVHTRPEEQPLPTGPKPEEVKVSPAVHKELPEPQELPPEDPDTEDETPEVSDTDSEEETSDESLTDSTASESAEEPEIEEDDSDFAENPESESEPAEEAADDENSDSSEEDASDREVRDILTKEQMLEALASMGFYSDPDAPDEETDEELSDHGELIEGEKAWDAEIRRIEGFIAERGGLYPKKLIETFTALMLTHDMVVLGGRSGTGKTSFCQRYAEAIGADVTIVPVKPNWMSTEDLLGYFNPVNGTYVSTLFRDALLQAAAHPEKMHLVVLDEMNIAIPEHYFADFLSRLEDRTVPEPEIVLPGIPKNKDPAPRKAQYAVCKVILSFLGDKGSDVTLQDMLGD